MSRKKQFRLSAADIGDLASGHGACVASDHITVGGQPVGFMYRISPETEVDSGRVFMSGQESQAYMDDPGNLALYTSTPSPTTIPRSFLCSTRPTAVSSKSAAAVSSS